MIEVIQPKRNKKHEVHPEWEHWMTESTYTHRQAREELGLTNGGSRKNRRTLTGSPCVRCSKDWSRSHDA